ncbi:MAG TPA: PDZ domain-containing protein [Blastocatellia bacterium]|nr:PDZ domain-containing protein [Blastocatellia bacterium]
MSKVAVFLFVVLCALTGAAQTPPPQPPPANPWAVSVIHTVDFQKLVEWMKRQGNERIAVPASPPAYVYNFATGMVIDDQGHIITRLVNLTPFDKEPIINVTTADGSMHRARLIGMDGATGFALLEVASLKSGAPKVAVAETLNAGARVQILSTDIQQQMQTTSQGTRIVYTPAITVVPGSIGQSSIYAKARGALTVYSGNLLSRNDSSVVITPENQVVGIAQFAGFGRAYLFPLAFIRDTVARRVLEKQGFVPAGWLGARGDSVAQLTDEEFNQVGLPSRAGVVLRQVAPNSPAALSGMQPGDVILSVDGFNIVSTADLIALLSMSPAGRKVMIRASRNHQPVEFTATLGARAESEWQPVFSPTEQQLEPLEVRAVQLWKRREELILQHRQLQEEIKQTKSRKAAEMLNEIDFEIRTVNEAIRQNEMESHQPLTASAKPDLTREIIGGDFVVGDLNEQLASYFKVPKGGVWVKQVAVGSAAARIGLKAGDIIVSARDQELTSVEQLLTLLSAKGGKVTLKVIRNNQPLSISFDNNQQ